MTTNNTGSLKLTEAFQLLYTFNNMNLSRKEKMEAVEALLEEAFEDPQVQVVTFDFHNPIGGVRRKTPLTSCGVNESNK